MCALQTRGWLKTKHMASPPNESRNLASYLDFDEDVYYGSDTNVPGDEGISSHSFVTEARPLTAPNILVERGEPPRQWRSIMQHMQVNTSSPTRSISNRS